MLYFLHGSDKGRSLSKARKIVEALLAKRPEANVFRLNPESWDNARFEELLVSGGLFAEKHAVVLNAALEVEAIAEAVLAALGAMRESPNVFIWVEGEVAAAVLAKVEKAAEKVEEHVMKAGPKKEEPNRFALADAFGDRDKRRAWPLLMEALEAGEPEEVHGILWWCVKSMLSVESAKTAEEAGVKPYTFTKAKRQLGKWKEGELAKVADRMVKGYHEARRGRGDLGRGLERVVLES